MSTKVTSSGLMLTRKKYTPALLGRWQRQVLAEAVPSSAERAELKRVELER